MRVPFSSSEIHGKQHRFSRLNRANREHSRSSRRNRYGNYWKHARTARLDIDHRLQTSRHSSRSQTPPQHVRLLSYSVSANSGEKKGPSLKAVQFTGHNAAFMSPAFLASNRLIICPGTLRNTSAPY